MPLCNTISNTTEGIYIVDLSIRYHLSGSIRCVYIVCSIVYSIVLLSMHDCTFLNISVTSVINKLRGF